MFIIISYHVLYQLIGSNGSCTQFLRWTLRCVNWYLNISVGIFMCFAIFAPVSSGKMLQQEIIARRRRCLFFIFWYMQVHMMYREIWVHPLNQSRLDKGEFYSLYPDLRHYPQKFFTFYRMPVAKFDELLWQIALSIRRKSSNFCQPISPEQQLVLTLRCVLSAYYHFML